MTEQKIYVIKGTRYEPGEVYPELGKIETTILGYATGDFNKIKAVYYNQSYLHIEIEPIEVNCFRENKLEEALA